MWGSREYRVKGRWPNLVVEVPVKYEGRWRDAQFEQAVEASHRTAKNGQNTAVHCLLAPLRQVPPPPVFRGPEPRAQSIVEPYTKKSPESRLMSCFQLV